MHADGSKREGPAVVAAAVSALLAIGKLGAFWVTGSASLLATAIDSLVDVLISSVNALIIRAAGAPADEGHPFGHGKLEHLAALLQSLVVGALGVAAGWQGWQRLEGGEPLVQPGLGLAVAALSTLVALGLAVYLTRAAKAMRSPALNADAAHYTSDWMINAGAVLAILGEMWLETTLIDAAVAFLVAILILRTALQLFAESASSLLDRGLAEDEVQAVHQALRSFQGRIHGYHDLLTRRSGQDRFVQFHIEVEGTTTLVEAHNLAEEVRRAVEALLPGSRVMIHLDPWPEDTARDPHDAHAPSARL
jgi:ferrous-iron efflux pump FieF